MVNRVHRRIILNLGQEQCGLFKDTGRRNLCLECYDKIIKNAERRGPVFFTDHAEPSDNVQHKATLVYMGRDIRIIENLQLACVLIENEFRKY